MFKNLATLTIKLGLFFLLIVWAIAILHSENISSAVYLNKSILILIILFLEFFVLLIYINIFYEKPIKNLETSVKFFLLWDNSNSEKYMKNTINPHKLYNSIFPKSNIFTKKYKRWILTWKRNKMRSFIGKGNSRKNALKKNDRCSFSKHCYEIKTCLRSLRR